ncbi:MAG: hypothetical protein AUI36_35255 [Cyanobacteria bacterium 13_1_40CM_2_61_4]|nr:MAG: hypothetical protein AUI36_35255 [Cyanobacteria bacterium 13_1_40CM_2_61_4]
MTHPIIVGDEVWCPRCKKYVQLLKIKKAARVADVSCKTIYRYIEEGKVHSVKIAGATTRVCSSCLFEGREPLFS